MGWDDDDDDDDFNFNFDDLSPEEKEKIEKEMEEKENFRDNHPLFKKAREIFDLTHAFCDSLDEDTPVQSMASEMRNSAMMLAPKIAGAMGSESWLISMMNAAIIREHAQHILISTSGMGMFDEPDKEYVKLIRTEILEFKNLFIEWVKSFDKLDDEGYDDEWGLFVRKK